MHLALPVLTLPVLTLPVLALPVLALCLAASPAVAAPKVIASVVPVYGIVSAVMGETGQPELLLSGTMSEHRATFTPQQIAGMGKADVVFIIGQGLEAKLSQISGSEAVNGKRFVELSSAPGITTHPARQRMDDEPKGHRDSHHAAEVLKRHPRLRPVFNDRDAGPDPCLVCGFHHSALGST